MNEWRVRLSTQSNPCAMEPFRKDGGGKASFPGRSEGSWGGGCFREETFLSFVNPSLKHELPVFHPNLLNSLSVPSRNDEIVGYLGGRDRGRFSLPLFISSLVPRMMMARFFVF